MRFTQTQKTKGNPNNLVRLLHHTDRQIQTHSFVHKSNSYKQSFSFRFYFERNKFRMHNIYFCTGYANSCFVFFSVFCEIYRLPMVGRMRMNWQTKNTKNEKNTHKHTNHVLCMYWIIPLLNIFSTREPPFKRTNLHLSDHFGGFIHFKWRCEDLFTIGNCIEIAAWIDFSHIVYGMHVNASARSFLLCASSHSFRLPAESKNMFNRGRWLQTQYTYV